MLFQVSFSISVYNACNEYAASYNDKMVDATSSVIKKKALETILSYFENGRLKFWCHILTQIVNPLCLMSLQSCLLLFSFSTFFLKLIHTFFSPDHIPLLHMLPLLLALDCVHIITSTQGLCTHRFVSQNIFHCVCLLPSGSVDFIHDKLSVNFLILCG